MAGFESWEPPRELQARGADDDTKQGGPYDHGEVPRSGDYLLGSTMGQQLEQPVRRAAPGLPSEQFRRSDPDAVSSYGLDQDPFGLSGEWKVDPNLVARAKGPAPVAPPVPPDDRRWDRPTHTPASSSLVTGLDSEWPAPVSQPVEPEWQANAPLAGAESVGDRGDRAGSLWDDLPSLDEGVESSGARKSGAIGFWSEQPSSSPPLPGLSHSTVVVPEETFEPGNQVGAGEYSGVVDPVGYQDHLGYADPNAGLASWQDHDYQPDQYGSQQGSLLRDRTDVHNIRVSDEFGDGLDYQSTPSWRTAVDELLEMRWFTPIVTTGGVLLLVLVCYGVYTSVGNDSEVLETVDAPTTNSTQAPDDSRTSDARSNGASVLAVPTSDLSEAETTIESTTTTDLSTTVRPDPTTTSTTEATTTTTTTEPDTTTSMTDPGTTTSTVDPDTTPTTVDPGTTTSTVDPDASTTDPSTDPPTESTTDPPTESTEPTTESTTSSD